MSIYICPKCGSTNWKMASPIKASESGMINIPSMVQNLLECLDCGYIGPFFAVEMKDLDDVQKMFKK